LHNLLLGHAKDFCNFTFILFPLVAKPRSVEIRAEKANYAKPYTWPPSLLLMPLLTKTVSNRKMILETPV